MTTIKDTVICSVVLLILVSLSIEGKADDTDEPIFDIRKLKKDLLDKYDKYARPVKNVSAPVPVQIQIFFRSLFELDEIKETMTLNVIMYLLWKDDHLMWDPEKYNGIKHVHFGESEIWHPDLIVYNSAPVTNIIPWSNSDIVTFHTGKNLWYPPASLKVHCPSPLLKPMEERECNVSIASYSYLRRKLDLKLAWNTVRLSKLSTKYNPIWEVINITASVDNTYPLDFEYSIANFTVRIKRRRDFVSDVIIGPRTISILLTLSMFLLPSTSDKKLNLGCLVLLVLSGTTLYLSSTVSSPSILTETVAPLHIILFAVVSAVVIEVVVINLSRLSDLVRPPPTLIRILSGMVGRVIGVCSRLEYKEDGGIIRLPEGEEEEEHSEATISVEEEWSLVAMSLDRIFFVIYAVIFIIVSQ